VLADTRELVGNVGPYSLSGLTVRAEIVKQAGGNGPLSGLLYPILQILDEEYLKVDVQLGGLYTHHI
jgi:tyrosyl-tRNA synthetase